MMRLKVTLEIEVEDVPAQEQIDCGMVGESEIMKVSDFEPMEIANVLQTETPEMWENFFAGSDVWATFKTVKVTDATAL